MITPGRDRAGTRHDPDEEKTGRVCCSPCSASTGARSAKATTRFETVSKNCLRSAQEELYVEHCYPSDAELLMRWGTLIKERPNGPKCTLIFPNHYDTAVLGLECDRFFPELMEAGAEVYGYDKAIMHSKIAVADGFYVAAGSFNLTIHSARMALEYELFIPRPQLRRRRA